MLDGGFESDLAKHDGLLMREGWKDTEEAREAGSELNRGARQVYTGNDYPGMRKSANAHEWALVGREAGRAGGGVECRRRKRGVDDSPVFPRLWGRPARSRVKPPPP